MPTSHTLRNAARRQMRRTVDGLELDRSLTGWRGWIGGHAVAFKQLGSGWAWKSSFGYEWSVRSPTLLAAVQAAKAYFSTAPPRRDACPRCGCIVVDLFRGGRRIGLSCNRIGCGWWTERR
jgi:hypothetical protein